MHHGVYVPNYGEFGDPAALVELGVLAEENDWEGFFLWDHIVANWAGGGADTADAWVVLSALAAQTSKIRLGAMITPLPRREVSKVAHEVVCLDRLSKGRVVFGTGLGVLNDCEAFGLERDQLKRGKELSAKLRVLRGLWAGESTGALLDGVSTSSVLHPRPWNERTIPIWVAARWPPKFSQHEQRWIRGPFKRACWNEGLFPVTRDWKPPDGLVQPDDYRDITRLLEELGSTDPIDLVHGGVTDGSSRASVARNVDQYAQAGVTWWLESFHENRGGLGQALDRIAQGPLGRT